MTKKTFDFGNNPINQFISGSTLSNTQNPTAPLPSSNTLIAEKEKKDKRICVMLQPALYKDIAKIARVKGISKNETICRAIKDYRDNEKRDLEKYRTFFEEQERI